MAGTVTTNTDVAHETIDTGDYSKKPWKAKEYANMRGVVDWGNLMQFAPYESGYCFLVVINGPSMTGIVGNKGGFQDLQEAFIKILEQEFKGLSGIENISSDTMEISDGITSIQLLGKVNQPTSSQISMEFTEKSGSLITKYLSTYLRFVRDPKTQAKTYGGAIGPTNAATSVGLYKEVFNFLYIITDSTCYNIEKAFLILNAQPTEAPYSDLYNDQKGNIETKSVSVNFNAFVTDGSVANKLALAYMRAMIVNSGFADGAININSYEMNWTISGIDGTTTKAKKLKLKRDKEEEGFEFSTTDGANKTIDISTALTGGQTAGKESYDKYNPGNNWTVEKAGE